MSDEPEPQQLLCERCGVPMGAAREQWYADEVYLNPATGVLFLQSISGASWELDCPECGGTVAAGGKGIHDFEIVELD